MPDNPASMLTAAAEGPDLARCLLRVPDSALLAGGDDLLERCRADRVAHDFVRARLTTLMAVRGTDGSLPPALTIQLEHARIALRKLAGETAAGRKPDRASGGQPAPPEGQPPAGGETAREARP